MALKNVIFKEGVEKIEISLADYKKLEEVTFPSTLKEIGDNSFKNCASLKKVDLKDGVTTLGQQAFYGCNGLTKVDLPNTITTVGAGAFANCSDLKEIAVSNGATNITDIFYDSNNLQKIVFKEGVATIPYIVLSNSFSNIQTVSFPSTLAEIPDYILRSCTSLNNVTISDGSIPLTIGDWSFSETSITSIQLPTRLREIGDHSFYRANLERVEFFENIEVIGEHAFQSCAKLAQIRFSDMVKSNLIIKGAAFSTDTELRTINFPEGLIAIEQEAFISCGNLENITFPSTLQKIGLNAFANCVRANMDSAIITLPSSLTTVEELPFNYCTQIKTVILENGIQWKGFSYPYQYTGSDVNVIKN